VKSAFLIAVALALASIAPARAQAPEPHAIFNILPEGQLVLDVGHVDGLRLPDGAVFVFQNADSALVIWFMGKEAARLTTFATSEQARAATPDDVPIFTVRGLGVIFVFRAEDGTMLAGIVYRGPPEKRT